MIITVTNQKGGTGKTTTSVNMAAYLGQLGKKVLLVDLDPQSNATSGIGLQVNEDTKGLYDLMMTEADPQSLIHRTSYRNLHIIPGTGDSAGISVEIVNHPEREFILYKKMQMLKEQYDFLIIDSPPSLGLLTLNGLVAADGVLIPVQCEYYALEGLGQLLGTISLVSQNLKNNLKILGALLTMHDRRNRLSHQVAKEVKRYFPGHVFDSMIPRNVSLSEAPSFGKPIHKYAPLSKGAFAYKRLAQEIIEIAKKEQKSAI